MTGILSVVVVGLPMPGTLWLFMIRHFIPRVHSYNGFVFDRTSSYPDFGIDWKKKENKYVQTWLICIREGKWVSAKCEIVFWSWLVRVRKALFICALPSWIFILLVGVLSLKRFLLFFCLPPTNLLSVPDSKLTTVSCVSNNLLASWSYVCYWVLTW